MSDRFKTPLLGNVRDEDFNQVYEPAEDSFLLLDALEKEDNFLQTLKPTVCVEVGCGSGICITFLSQLLEYPALFICTDINPKAAEMTQLTALRNGKVVEIVVCNLVDTLEERLAGTVDVLLFNPPYVVTPSSEIASADITASWAGGVRGREVTDKLLPKVKSLLSSNGVFYLVAIQENDIDDIQQLMCKNGFRMTCVASRRAGREFLTVLKFVRQ
ncbi:unnamed protein product [Candidula unifasciata]|uniref:Methyltransferase HEMK2 n=1 Tax=Candidula unifasciata TaxID=100452 RepID=A0A8S4A3K3_9EUPU|nr:unnamed protein product [Candidula unifasciata]